MWGASQRRTSIARWGELGSECARECLNVCRREVRLSPTTREAAGDHRIPAPAPRDLHPERHFDRGPPASPWMSGTIDLTSTTSTTRDAACQATAYRSSHVRRERKKVAIGTTSQSNVRKIPVTTSTSPACAASSNRSSASPFRASRRSVAVPSACAARSASRPESSAAAPLDASDHRRAEFGRRREILLAPSAANS